MLRIDRERKSFTLLPCPSLSDCSISERYDLQEYISNSPEAFFEELGEHLFLVGKEIEPSQDLGDRIDLLALDRKGHAVIVELKRGNHKLHMLQAIAYAAMVAKWSPDEFLRFLDPDKIERLTEFLAVDREEINRTQRIVLVAEAFDYSVLLSAEWLSEQFGVDIVCCKLGIAKDPTTGFEFLFCSNVFPAPEIAQHAIPRGRAKRPITKDDCNNWEEALATITNEAIVSFFKSELAAGQGNYLRHKSIRYSLSGKRRWFVSAKKQNAYVWQEGRFEGDIGFWQSRVVQPEEVIPVQSGRSLRFLLSSNKDFASFKAATTELSNVKWVEHEMERVEDGGANGA